jgi:hypothetical protein
LPGALVLLGGFTPSVAAVSVGAAVRPSVVAAMPTSASPAGAAGEKPREGRVELSDSLLGDIDRDRLVLRGGLS